MLDYDLRRDFITDNYGLVGIIFHGIMARVNSEKGLIS